MSERTVDFVVDGDAVSVRDDGRSLLDALRTDLARHNVKDGCSPQGQCGCCTVLIDGQARVSCVTPLARVAGREVTTSLGLSDAARLAECFVSFGASQCGFCTPGIVTRIAALRESPRTIDDDAIRRALGAHLCRCTGWQSIVDASHAYLELIGHDPLPEEADASARAQIEGPRVQVMNENTVLGRFEFSADRIRTDVVVGCVRADGEVVFAEDLVSARRRSAKVQGRNSSKALCYPLSVAPGEWVLTLQTTWVEPAYLEPDACVVRPGEPPTSVLANGGAFGAKRASLVVAQATSLSEEVDGPAGVVWSREDVVRLGPKRPPMSIGLRGDGSGVVRIAKSPLASGIDELADQLRTTYPSLVVELCEVPGPAVSATIRRAGFAEVEASYLALAQVRSGWRHGEAIEANGANGATASVAFDGETLSARVAAGSPLSIPTLRSYCYGAMHQAWSWVRSEGIAVDEHGEVLDKTIRSFGVLTAKQTPKMTVVIDENDDRESCNVSDLLFATTAALAWLESGRPTRWPTERAG